MATEIRANENEDRSENESAMDNWKLILIFFVGLIICVVFFAAGLIVGRHQPRLVDASDMPTGEPGRLAAEIPVHSTTIREKPEVLSSSISKETVMKVSSQSGRQDTPQKNSPLARKSKISSVASPPNPQEGSRSETLRAERSSMRPAGFRVQIAALRSRREAQSVVNTLKRKGFKAFVVHPRDPSDPYYRVQMGDYVDRASAQEVILRLREAGEKPVLKRHE